MESQLRREEGGGKGGGNQGAYHLVLPAVVGAQECSVVRHEFLALGDRLAVLTFDMLAVGVELHRLVGFLVEVDGSDEDRGLGVLGGCAVGDFCVVLGDVDAEVLDVEL